MYFENCKRELEENGIHAELIQMQKNAVEMTGLRLGEPEEVVRPVIYPRADEPMWQLVERAKSALRGRPKLDAAPFHSWEYVQDHIRLGIQRRSGELVLKKKCLNLDLVMRIQIDLPDGNTGSTKVTDKIVEILGVTEGDLWKAARKNSRSEYKIRSMGEMIGLADDGTAQLYVVTTADMTNGAAVLAFPEVFQEFCLRHHEECCAILPSSTEEVIVVAGSMIPGDLQSLADMVRDINSSIVDPVIQLDPVAYMYSLDTDRIVIAAQA